MNRSAALIRMTAALVSGWTCSYGESTQIAAFPFAGGGPGQGVELDGAWASEPSEPAVYEACADWSGTDWESSK